MQEADNYMMAYAHDVEVHPGLGDSSDYTAERTRATYLAQALHGKGKDRGAARPNPCDCDHGEKLMPSKHSWLGHRRPPVILWANSAGSTPSVGRPGPAGTTGPPRGPVWPGWSNATNCALGDLRKTRELCFQCENALRW